MPLEILHLLTSVFIQGIIYSFVVMGVHISSRIIKFDDLTTEGSFGLGGAMTAFLLLSGASPWVALFCAVLSGALAGMATGFLHAKLKMNNLISGLVVTTALFSICLKLASSNASLPDGLSIFPKESLIIPVKALMLFACLAGSIFWTIKKFLQSELGLLLKTVGCNPQMIISLGKSVAGYKIFGLSLANSLTALAGALFVQWNGYFSITGNVGTLVIGLAGLILAEMIKPKFSLSLLFGAILYQAIFALTIEFELEPMWNNLIKAAIITLLIQLKPNQQKLVQR